MVTLVVNSASGVVTLVVHSLQERFTLWITGFRRLTYCGLLAFGVVNLVVNRLQEWLTDWLTCFRSG